jgi:hypothetical protein
MASPVFVALRASCCRPTRAPSYCYPIQSCCHLVCIAFIVDSVLKMSVCNVRLVEARPTKHTFFNEPESVSGFVSESDVEVVVEARGGRREEAVGALPH